VFRVSPFARRTRRPGRGSVGAGGVFGTGGTTARFVKSTRSACFCGPRRALAARSPRGCHDRPSPRPHSGSAGPPSVGCTRCGLTWGLRLAALLRCSYDAATMQLRHLRKHKPLWPRPSQPWPLTVVVNPLSVSAELSIGVKTAQPREYI
jgi:hypothetical protein